MTLYTTKEAAEIVGTTPHRLRAKAYKYGVTAKRELPSSKGQAESLYTKRQIGQLLKLSS